MSSNELRRRDTIYKVVVNHEEQYSIWPADRENALGWTDVGATGTKADVGKKWTKAECLAYIKEVWTDMRPLSLRKEMDELGETHDKTKYALIVNKVEMYSIWPADRENAMGWSATGETGSGADCLESLGKAYGEPGPVK